MNSRKRILAASLGLAGVVAAPLAAAGTAHADEEFGYDSVRENSDGFETAQSPLQVVQTLGAVAETANFSFVDSLDTFSPDNRPDGVNGTDSEFPQADPRFVEGPVGGLIKNGPVE